MTDLQIATTYFAEPGPHNTEGTLELVLQHARKMSISHVVVASDTGKTARRSLDLLGKDFRVVVVTNPANLRFPVAKLHDYLPRFKAHKQALVEEGVTHIPCSLSNETVAELEGDGALVRRMDWKRFQAFTRVGLGSVDRVGVGVRVALTVAVWASISGDVPMGLDVIAVAGTGFGGGGADTAVVVRTAAHWQDVRVLEILAKPRIGPPSELPG